MYLSLVPIALLCFNQYTLPVFARFDLRRDLSDIYDTTGHLSYVSLKVRVAAPIPLNHAAYIQSRQGSIDSPESPAQSVSVLASAPTYSPTADATVSTVSALTSTLSAAVSSAAISMPDAVTSSAAAALSTPDTAIGAAFAAAVSPAAVSISRANDAMTAMNLDNSTLAPCTQALGALNGQASSPSGMAICYNVLQFDNTTGNFESVLGLYQVGEAMGDWASVPQNNMNIGVVYPGANIEMADGSNTKRDEMLAWPSLPRSAELDERDGPLMVKDMDFVGQADAMMGELTNETAMMVAVMPIVTLSGTTPNGTVLNSVLSNMEASFVTGIFANMASETANATAPPPQVVSPTASPFVYPGVTLGIFPTGLIVASSWSFLFVFFVGLGTLGRWNMRASYRRRQKEMRTGNRPRGKTGW